MARLSNTQGTSSATFSIGDAIIEHVNDGSDDDGLKLTFPNNPSVYIRA